MAGVDDARERDEDGPTPPDPPDARARLASSSTIGVAATAGDDPATAPTRPPLSGARVARGDMLDANYRVLREIGRGAMGAVYEVEHVALGKRFAAKVLVPTRLGEEESIRRLQQEARAASAIDHENIVGVTHLGESPEGLFFVVMELLEGGDLGRRLAASVDAEGRPVPLPNALTRDVVAQILRGLAAAHEAGIVHRDLKPENVFLARRRGYSRVKIVDFGISKLSHAADASRLTQTGQVLGTPLYMAPEQTRGDSRAIDGRADLYSLGVIAYEMVTARHPFDASSLYEVLMRHAHDPPTPPRAFRADLPVAVERVILRALAKRPEERFDDAYAMLEAWEDAWRDAVSPDEVGLGDPVMESGGRVSQRSLAASTTPLSTRETLSTGDGRRRRGVAVGALALAAALAGGAFVLLGRGEGDDPSAAAPTRPRPAAGSAAQTPPALAPAPPVEPPPAPAPRTVRLRSTPPGAAVLEAGERIGTTPMELVLAPGAARELTLSRAGHRERRVRLDYAETLGDDLQIGLEPARPSRRAPALELAPR